MQTQAKVHIFLRPPHTQSRTQMNMPEEEFV